MKKIETHVFEVQPEELRKLPEGTQVLCYDTLFKKYSVIKAQPNAIYEALCAKYFLFDLPEGFEAV